MRLAIVIAALGLVAAGSAAASTRVTDMDYLKANRCKGLAMGLGADTAGLNAFLKAEGRARAETILSRGEEEATRARRQASDANLKDRLSAELTSTCSAYMNTGKSVPSQ